MANWAKDTYGREYTFYGAYFYYIDELGKKELSAIENVDLSEEYCFDVPNLENDSEKILENYPHSYPQTIESIKY